MTATITFFGLCSFITDIAASAVAPVVNTSSIRIIVLFSITDAFFILKLFSRFLWRSFAVFVSAWGGVYFVRMSIPSEILRF